MAELERTYNIPLRKEFQKARRDNRAKRAMRALQDFLAKHMKSDKVLIGPKLNEQIWSRSIQNPPHHVKVVVSKDKEGVVKAELFGFKFKELKQKTTHKAEGLMDKMKEKVGLTDDGKEEAEKEKEEKVEEKSEEPKEEKKTIKPKAKKVDNE